MENQTIDVMIAKNQIAIDFDAIEKFEEEEESSILPKGLVNAQNLDWIKEEVLFVGIKTTRKQGQPNISEIKICGKTCLEWLMLAGSGCENIIINDPQEDLISALKQIKTDKKFIAVFYDETPLVDVGLFQKIMCHFTKTGLNALSLPRGYVFRRDFLFCIETFASPCLNQFDERAFTLATSSVAINEIANVLYKKIKNFHLKNGVILMGSETIFIDGDVEIESGTIIYPNNIIKGQTVIGKNVILESGNIIEDSIISDECYISDAFIQKSKIGSRLDVTGEHIVNQSL